MNLRRGTKQGIKQGMKIVGVTLFAAAFISIFGIMQINKNFLESSRQHTAALAQIAAQQIDGSEFALLRAGDEGTERYQKIFNQLSGFLVDSEITYIYSMRIEDGKLQFVVDTDTEEGSAIGELYESYDKIEEAFRGKVTVDDEVTTDGWGSFYSAFAPIYDGKEVVGIVGVDYSVKTLAARIRGISWKLILLSVLAVIPGLVLALTEVIGRKKLRR